MGWLDVLNPQLEIRPARPAEGKTAGRQESIQAVSLSSPSSHVQYKKCSGKLSALASSPGQTKIDQRTLEYARSLLVDCPGHGRKLHCWHCARCGYALRCNAWQGHYARVKEFEGRGKPLSLLVLEDEEALERGETGVPQ